MCTRPQVKGFPYQSQPMKAGRGDCFLKCLHTYTSLSNHKESETDTTKGIRETCSNWPQGSGEPGIAPQQNYLLC